MKVAVVGLGYVGLALVANFLNDGYEIIGFDTDNYKIASLKDGKVLLSEPKIESIIRKNINNAHFTNKPSDLTEASLIYLCVNTPEKHNWDVEMKYFDEAKNTILKFAGHDSIIIVKSTVPVGTTRKMNEEFQKARPTGRLKVLFSPEFLRQGFAYEDVRKPSRVVYGGNIDEGLKELVMSLHAEHTNQIIFTDFESAELAKYAANNFLALKISFINEIANFAAATGANIEDVKKIMVKDPRISDGCFNAGIGFGGGCFVKDTKALYYQNKEKGLDAKTIKATIDRNTLQNRILLKKVEERYKGLNKIEKAKILFVGLSFKGNSGDIRGSIAVENLKILQKYNKHISLYDPLVEPNTLKKLGHNVVTNLEEAVANNQIIFIFTEREEINKLDSELFEKKVVLDGRGILDKEKIEECKYYFSPTLGEIKKR